MGGPARMLARSGAAVGQEGGRCVCRCSTGAREVCGLAGCECASNRLFGMCHHWQCAITLIGSWHSLAGAWLEPCPTVTAPCCRRGTMLCYLMHQVCNACGTLRPRCWPGRTCVQVDCLVHLAPGAGANRRLHGPPLHLALHGQRLHSSHELWHTEAPAPAVVGVGCCCCCYGATGSHWLLVWGCCMRQAQGTMSIYCWDCQAAFQLLHDCG